MEDWRKVESSPGHFVGSKVESIGSKVEPVGSPKGSGPPSVTRRALLVVAGVALVSAAGLHGLGRPQASPSRSRPAAPDPALSTVRLSGRLVATRLERAWVQARREGGYVDLCPSPEELAAAERAIGAPVIDPIREGGGWRESTFCAARPGASWAVPYGATLVDADGAFSLDLPPGTHVLFAGAVGCPTRVETIRLDADRRVEWRLAWSAPSRLTLRCVDEANVPLARGRLLGLREARLDGPLVDLRGPTPGYGDDDWLRTPPGALVPHEGIARLLPLDATGAVTCLLPSGRWTLGERVEVHGPDDAPGTWSGLREATTLRLEPGEERTVTLRLAFDRP